VYYKFRTTVVAEAKAGISVRTKQTEAETPNKKSE